MSEGRSTHIVFSTGCSEYFDWQSLGLAYSHLHVRQPGRLTRLVSQCPDEETRRRTLALPLMGTHEHPDFGVPSGNRVQDHYAQYNKPAGLHHWLESLDDVEVQSQAAATGDRTTTARRLRDRHGDYILLLESDMLLRQPVDCGALGTRPGLAASTRVDYLKGASNGMARGFVKNVHLVQPVGGWVCVHRDDLRRLAPLWLEYTKQVHSAPCPTPH